MHNIDENEVLRDAFAGLNEDVPPMPEGLHAAWMQKVEESKLEEKRIARTHTRQTITRWLSVAAALVFVIGGTLLTRDDLSWENGSSDGMLMQSRTLKSAPYEDNSADYDFIEEEAAAGETLMFTSGADNGVMLTSSTSTAAAAQTDKKIIRTDSLNALRSSCEGLGGWIESSSESTSSYSGLRTAYMTLRIPQTALDSFLTGTEALGRITSRSESAQDVTASYQDTQTRLDTQLALMARLQALITESADLSDLLALESQIADTQYQIDRLQSSLNSTDRQVSYSTVDITLREENTVELTDTTVTLGERIRSAVQLGWESFTGFLSDMLVFLVAALPFIAVVAAAVVVIRVIRRIRRRK